MTLTKPLINTVLKLWNVRGQQLSTSVTSLFQLTQASPVDISSVASATMLLAQAYSQAQIVAGEIMISDSIFTTLSLDSQETVFSAYTTWLEMDSLLGSVAFQENFPLLDSITQPSAASRLFGAVSANPSTINSALETFLSVPTLVGITPNIFWQLTTKAREELSQVISVDLALNSNLSFYDFADNVAFINVIIDILTNMVPLTINVSNYVNQVNTFMAPGLQNSTFTSIQTVSVPANATVESLALTYTGSADNWEQIVIQNKLTYPYITNDPIKKLGTPLMTTPLIQTTLSSGASTMFLGDVNGLYQNCIVLLQSGNFYDIMTIESVGPIPIDSLNSLPIDSWSYIDTFGQVTTFGTVSHTYTASDTIVSLYLPFNDQGTVLTTGDTILIPITGAIRQTSVTSANTEDKFLYGADIQVTQGNLTVSNGDITMVAGVGNISQAIQNQFATSKQSLVEHPTYGNSLQTFIGLRNSPYYANLAAIDSVQTAISDPRVQSATSTASVTQADQLNIDLKITLKTGTTISPVRLTTPVTFGAS